VAAIERAQQIHDDRPGSWFACQHENPDNVAAHYATTGPEIWTDTDGSVDVLVCGVGTGGTLTGTARFLKEQNPAVRVVAVEPELSPVISKGFGGLHRIPGLNGGFIAPTTDLEVIDEVLTVSNEDAFTTAQLLARTAGLLVGVSSGAAAHACRVLASRPEYAGKTIVTVFPDTGERYLSWLEAAESDSTEE
jgi:cysteine synthase A